MSLKSTYGAANQIFSNTVRFYAVWEVGSASQDNCCLHTYSQVRSCGLHYEILVTGPHYEITQAGLSTLLGMHCNE